MRYLDRRGYEISAADWQRLSRDPAYCRVTRDQLDAGSPARGGLGRVAVETSWVGVALTAEPLKGAGIFHGRVVRLDGADGEPLEGPVELCERWFATEGEAREWHAGQVKKAGRGLLTQVGLN